MNQTLGDVMRAVVKYGITHVLVGFCLVPLTSFAHHSFFGRFDTESIVELQGEVTEVFWRNPHAIIILTVEDDDGRRVPWEIETNAPVSLQRMGISASLINLGDEITVAGYPPTRSINEMHANHILIPSGQELLMTFGLEPRWSDEGLGDDSYRFQTDGDSSDPDRGIFRVWSHTNVIPRLFSETSDLEVEVSSYPITDAARAALAAFDRATDNPTANCAPKGMPTIMEQPYPMEFVQAEENILLRLEEYDLVRTIHMEGDAPPANQLASSLGYSVGRWAESTLVVTTTRINWPFFSQLGIPQSEDSVIIERFSPTSDGSQLNYEITVTDPVNFTEPVVLEKYWLYLPNEEILPFDCSVRG